jgi:POT family proton-dependent oligopeptide transporter
LSRETKVRLWLILLLAALLCVFMAGENQMLGSWVLFINQSVDRSVGGFVVPVPWFQTWYATVIIAVGPLLPALWIGLEKRGRTVDIVQKYVFSLAAMSLGHFIMFGCAVLASRGHTVHLGLPIFAVALGSLGELVAWTSTFGFVYRAAPEGYGSVTMGAWYLITLGAGGYLAGLAGWGVECTGYSGTFLLIGCLMSLFAVAGLIMRPAVRRLAASTGVAL